MGRCVRMDESPTSNPPSDAESAATAKPAVPAEHAKPGKLEQLCHWRLFPRARWRLVLNVLGLLAITLVLLALILTQTPLTKRVVLPLLEKRTGLAIDAGAVRIEPNGTIVFENLMCRVPGVAGPGGRVLWADRVLVVPNWGGLTGGGLDWVHADGAIVRLSVDADTGRPNIASLLDRVDGTASGPFSSPELSLNASSFEYGEHSAAGNYEVLKPLTINGSIRRDDDRYTAVLLASRPAGGERVVAKAVLENRRVEAVLDEIDLVHWPPAIAPRPIRPLASALGAEGRARGVVFTYEWGEQAGDFSIAGALDGVAMTLPLDRDGNYRLTGERARIDGLSGTISIGSVDGVSAAAVGTVEGLPYELVIESEEVGFDAPFRIELMTRGFDVGDGIRLLSFAPDEVLDEFARFDRLSGIIDASAVVERTRRSDGTLTNGELTATLAFRDATASYRDFPYTFGDLRGTVTISPDLVVRLIGIEGEADTGATVRASGTFRTTPAGEGPDAPLQVELDIEVADVPIGPDEEAFVRAMAGQADALEQLFAVDAIEAADIEGFGLGGVGSIDIVIRRKFGGRGSWSNRIVVRSPTLGVVPKAFPMPITGEAVEITIFPLPDKAIRAVVDGAAVRVFGGGTGSVDLDLVVGPGDGGSSGPMIEPTVVVEVEGLPTSDALVRAIALVGEPSEPRDELADLLDGLGIDGTVSGEVWVDRLPSGELGVQVFAEVDDATLALESELGSGVRMRGVSGTIDVSERAVHVDAAGRVDGGGAWISAIATIGLGVDSEFLEVDVDAEGADAGLPIAESVAVFSGDAAAQVERVMDERRVEGVADVRTRVVRTGEGPIEITLVGERAEELSFDVPGGMRLTLTRSSGSATLEVGEMLRFDSFEADVAAGGIASGRAFIDGWLTLDGDEIGREGLLDVLLVGGRFESPLTRSLIEGDTGIDVQRWNAWKPAGEYDSYARIAADDGSLAVEGWLQPITLALTLGEQRLAFPRIAGVIELGDDGLVRFDGLRVETDDRWSAAIDGSLETTSNVLELVLGFASEDGLTDSVRTLLPEAVADAIERIAFDSSDRIEVEIERLETTLGSGRPPIVAGSALFAGASADIGVALVDVVGQVAFATEPTGATTIDLALERAKAFGVTLNGVSGAVAIEDGGVALTDITGATHGGRFTVHGGISSGTNSGTNGRIGTATQRYDIGIELSNVRLASLLAEQNTAERPAAMPERPGRIDAGVSIAGVVGQAGTRTGRGEVRVQDGAVLSGTFFARLISVGNFQIPTTGVVRDARLSFFIDGDRVLFDRISAFVRSVELYGFGVFDLSNEGLNMYFASRSIDRIPVLTDVFDGIRDELLTVRVTGTLDDRQITPETLPVTRRLLEQLFGASRAGRSAEFEVLRRRAEEVRVPSEPGTLLQPIEP